MSSLAQLKERLADINALNSASGIMEWDQQTFMPPGGAAARAEHLGRLAKLSHEMFTSPETARLVETANPDDEIELAIMRVVRRDLEQATKIPASLVEEKARLGAEGIQTWVRARQTNDFSAFAPTLDRMFDIARREAQHLGFKDHIYDALIDRFEEGATKADIDHMFNGIRMPLVQLLTKIRECPQIDSSGLIGDWSISDQMRFTTGLSKSIGFDFDRGRQDTAQHPFCTGWSVGDVRITTRFGKSLAYGIFGTLHESGHGMYEQGSPKEWDRTPIAGGVSLGVHESQSRLWENIIGRSLPFWKRFFDQLKSEFPSLKIDGPESFFRAVNKVEPSLIRTEADEVTYNLHVLVRFEIECAVLVGDIRVADIPAVWNDKYRQYLGITPNSDANGCLQDVHWSEGMIGYFPTYSIGNLLSYQIWAALQREMGDADARIATGDFESVLGWLQNRIYSKGRSLKPHDLVFQVTGKALDPSDYLAGLSAKYKSIYRFA